MSKTKICSCCNEPITGLPLDYDLRLPDSCLMVPDSEKEKRISRPNSALRCLDNKYFYVRGLVELPILGTDDTLAWGTWIQVAKKDYKKCLKAWNSDGTPEERMVKGHIMGRLANTFPELYPDALNLEVAGCDRVGMAMYFLLRPSEHSLSVESHNGITMRRVHEIAEHMG